MIFDRRSLTAALLVLTPWFALTFRDTRALSRHHELREAVAGIAGIAVALTIYFHEEHHDGARCPSGPDPLQPARAGPTPPLEVRCALGHRRRCRPSVDPRGPAEYPRAAWHEDPIWRALAFELHEPHRFHYTLTTRSQGDTCEFTIQARADLDGDGSGTNIETRGRVHGLGLHLDSTWRIDQMSDEALGLPLHH
jgi:hypothetical protein